MAPSHTMRRGAKADFGRLFNTTRKGSVISKSFLLNQRSVAMNILKMVTRRKLSNVSYSVTPMCRKMLRSRTMPQKQSTTWLGLLKIKESSKNGLEVRRKDESFKWLENGRMRN